MKCLVCGSPSNRFYFEAHQFKLFWCDKCSFGRLAGDFTPEQVAGFYPEDYYTHFDGGREERRKTFADRLLVHAAYKIDHGTDFDPAELPPGKTACDVGCGNGSALRKFKSAGYQVVGIDPDPKAREVASAICEVHNGTAEAVPSLGKFDVVLLSHVLEHCIDPVLALQSVSSLLKDDGTVVIEVPNNSAIGFRWFREKWPWSDIPRHLSFFTERSLTGLAARSGLTVTRVLHTGFTRQFSPGWRRALPASAGWPLLLASGFAEPNRKYDSIRIHAQRSR